MWYLSAPRTPSEFVLSSSSSSPPPTLGELLDAVARLEKIDFHEVDLRIGESRIRVARGPSAAAAAPTVVAAAPAAPQPVSTAAPEAPAAADEAGLFIVEAPMVGTFYRRPRPEADPFVEVGDRVREGQALCIIEAMKTMNTIPAECAGEVVEIRDQDGAPVQFGDRLLAIRPS